jgi:hypothetical protein
MDGQTRESEAFGLKRINRCDMDGKAEGRVSGSEGVNLFRSGALGFIEWLDRLCVRITLTCRYDFFRLRQPTTNPAMPQTMKMNGKAAAPTCACSHREKESAR